MKLWDRLVWSVARQYYQVKKAVLRLKIGDRWEAEGAFGRRRYPDYETYLEHQKTKFSAWRARSIERHDRRFHEVLSGRLTAMPLDFRGRSVLCLAARQGSEVRAFIDQGAFSVGIDLNPGRGNRHVVVGDFHALQFAADSVDCVYTNSLDHAFDLDRIIAEVRRVLKPGAVLIIEVARGDGAGWSDAGPYESMVWRGSDPLVRHISDQGFRLEARSEFQEPWPGEQLTFRLVP